MDNRIKELRQKKQLSQEELGDLVGATKGQISKLETGKQPLNEGWMKRLSPHLDVEPWQLITREIVEFMDGKYHEDFVELDIRAGAGGGSLVEDGFKQIGTWSIPEPSIQSHVQNPKNIRIIQVVGDSMMPELNPGDRIMVDTADRTPSPPGMFVIWDGLGLVVKRCHLIPNTEPQKIKLSSKNSEYPSYDVLLDECNISGRVIGKWQWT